MALGHSADHGDHRAGPAEQGLGSGDAGTATPWVPASQRFGCGRIEVSPVFDFSMTWNRGVSFGVMQAEGLARLGAVRPDWGHRGADSPCGCCGQSAG